jgi:drug/metabolite transporter (DMT)-like permease
MLKGILAVFIGACSFGILSVGVKLGISQHGYSIPDISGVQAFLGMLILWLIFFGKKTNKFRPAGLAGRSILLPLLVSGSFIGLATFLYYLAVQRLPASIAIIMLMHYTWIAVVIEAIGWRKKPSGIQLLSLLLVLAGTVLAAGLAEEDIALPDIRGLLYDFGAAVFYALYLVASGRIAVNMPVIEKSAWMMTASLIAIFIVSAPGFLFTYPLTNIFWIWGLFFALFGTVIPPLLFTYGIPRTGVALGSILTSAELPVAVLASGLVLDEKVTAWQWGGVLVILLAIALPQVYLNRQRTG